MSSVICLNFCPFFTSKILHKRACFKKVKNTFKRLSPDYQTCFHHNMPSSFELNCIPLLLHIISNIRQASVSHTTHKYLISGRRKMNIVVKCLLVVYHLQEDDVRRCASTIGNFWSICLGVNVFIPLPFFCLLKSRIFQRYWVRFFLFSFSGLFLLLIKFLNSISPALIYFLSSSFLISSLSYKLFAKYDGVW